MKRYLILCIFSSWLAVKAQAPASFFTAFGGDGIDIGYSVKEIYYRQYIVAGSTTSYGAGSSDAFLSLIDSMGHIVWQRTYGSLLADVAKSVVFNPIDSGFVFVGYTSSYGNGGYDAYVVRTDKEGKMIWQAAYGGLDWDFAQDVVITTDSNIILCGKTYSEGFGKSDGYVLKVTMNSGGLIWKKSFGGSEDDNFMSIIKTTDGNYTMCGNTKSYGDSNNDFWLFKINTDGDSTLSIAFGNLDKAEYCYDFIQDSNGDLVFCGSYDTSYTNTGKNISYLIRTDINGNYIDEFKTAGAYTDDDKLVAISNSLNGDLYFFARKVNHLGHGIDLQPVTCDYGLTVLSATTYGDLSEDEPFDAVYTSDNGLVMVGYTKGFKSVYENVFFVKMPHTLLNAPNIVSAPNLNDFEPKGDFYYFDGVFYLKNRKSQTYNYQIFNTNGDLVQVGSVIGENIIVDPHLQTGIYVIFISGQEFQKKKFIKE